MCLSQETKLLPHWDSCFSCSDFVRYSLAKCVWFTFSWEWEDFISVQLVKVNLNPLTSNYSLLKVLLCTVIFITISTLYIDKQTSNEKLENISEGILSSWNTRFLRIIHLEKRNHHLGVLGFDSWSQEAEEICLWWLFFAGHFLLYISALTTETSMWAVLCSVFREKLFLFWNVWKLQFGLALMWLFTH